MTSTKIEWSFNKIARLQDLSDLVELLFPNNRNQQHAFVVVWISIKRSPHQIVPNLFAIGEVNGISRRTMERVRAKMRRMGLIDHVSRFNAHFGHQEGWILSKRFERSLGALAEKISELKDVASGSREKEDVLIQLTALRRRARKSELDAILRSAACQEQK